MAELIRFLDRDNWNEIKRGHVFDAVSYYNTDTRRPLTFFIPDEMQQEGQEITGKLAESVGNFNSVEVNGVMKSPEHKVVIGMKQRRVGYYPITGSARTAATNTFMSLQS